MSNFCGKLCFKDHHVGYMWENTFGKFFRTVSHAKITYIYWRENYSALFCRHHCYLSCDLHQSWNISVEMRHLSSAGCRQQPEYLTRKISGAGRKAGFLNWTCAALRCAELYFTYFTVLHQIYFTDMHCTIKHFTVHFHALHSLYCILLNRHLIQG